MLAAGNLIAAEAPVPGPAAAPTADAAAALKTKLAASELAWRKLRDEYKGNYEYDVMFTSWVGWSHTTTIVVNDNKVVARKFQQRSNKPPEPGKTPPAADAGTTGWQETTAAELGKNREGAPAKTIDELYQHAAEVVGKGVQEHQRWTTVFDANGIIRCFGFTDKRIADDAPLTGVSIDALRPSK